MKKKLLFLIPMIIVAVLLFMLRATGMTAHIAVSVIGLVLLIAYTIATKKEWKTPALEIAMRAFYGVALITGGIVLATDIAALAIVHKVCAALFAVLLVVLFVKKLVAGKK